MGFESENYELEEYDAHEHLPTHEELRVFNDIQAVLMRRHVAQLGLDTDADPTPYLLEWTKENGEHFRTAMNDLKKDNPALIEEYEHDPDAVISEISRRMTALAPH